MTTERRKPFLDNTPLPEWQMGLFGTIFWAVFCAQVAFGVVAAIVYVVASS